mmetsp:Transcript_46083/g.128093  ORF Transcript_46083/g.128093 Transcript_46083/m.128093 type:complete len:408 (-) Transcript_46083:212-1435(-)
MHISCPSDGEAETVPRPLQVAVLERLLAENREYGPVVRGGSICNHYSMALLAAWGLGAGDRELAKFHHYLDGSCRMSWQEFPAPQPVRLTRATWSGSGGIGDMSHVALFREFFLEEAATLGVDGLICAYLPHLVLGQHSGLFHPMIRLGFALMAPSCTAEEVAEALAYSSSRHTPLYLTAHSDFGPDLELPAPAEQAMPLASLAELEAQMHAAWEQLRVMYRNCGYSGRGNSFRILSQLYQDIRLRSVCLSHFPVSEQTAEASMLLAVQLALQVYISHQSFVTLHAVTGGHAVTDLLPRLHASARLVSAKLYWVWLSAVFVEKGAPPVRPWDQGVDVSPELAWPDVRRLALGPLAESSESSQAELGEQEPQVHCIKMVFTCDAMFRRKSHPLYLQTAHAVASQGRPW